MRRVLRTVLAVLSALLLGAVTACASLPTSSQPQRVDPSQKSDTTDTVFTPDGPADGASPEEIIAGFLQAGNAPTDNYAIAREFLTDAFAGSWQPDAVTRVVADLGTPKEGDDGAWTVAVSKQAEVAEYGAYRALEGAQRQDLEFVLEQVDGQWRIAQAPEGTTVTAEDFAVVFRAYPLYFLSQSRSYLVPDVRMFPVGLSTATYLANALLAGPSDWLRGAVVTAFPEGVSLEVDSVTTDEHGDANVQLASQFADAASASDQQYMLWQLEASLGQISTVSGVKLMIGGVSVQADDDTLAKPTVAGVSNQRPLVVAGGTLGVLDGDRVSALEDAPASIPADDVESLANRGHVYVYTTEKGLWRAIGEDAQRLDSGSFGPISLDPEPLVWTSEGGALAVVSLTGERTDLSLPSDIGHVDRVSVSPDGTRVAVLVGDGDRTSLRVASVNRSESGAPVSLAFSSVSWTLYGSPVGVDWSGEAQVAAVSREGEEGRVLLATIGGESSQLATPERPVRVAAGSASAEGVRVLASSGQLYALSGSDWTRVAEDVTTLTYRR